MPTRLKSEILTQVSEKMSHLNPKEVEMTIKYFLEFMSESLSRGEPIEIRSKLGTLSRRYHQPHFAINPRTGEGLTTKGTYSVHFNPASALKASVNEKRHEYPLDAKESASSVENDD